MALKRKKECPKCRGTMYAKKGDWKTEPEELVAEPVWKCANCGYAEKREFRKSKKDKKLDNIFKDLLGEDTMSRAKELLKVAEALSSDDMVDQAIDEIPGNKVPNGAWGYIKTILAILYGNKAEFVARTLIDAVKKKDVSNFYVDDRAGIKPVKNSAYFPMGVFSMGKKDLNKAITGLRELY